MIEVKEIRELTPGAGAILSTDKIVLQRGTVEAVERPFSDVDTYVNILIGTYVAAQDLEVFKGAIDCSANPNYPAADAGNVYRVSVAGKIGGASGPNVEIGDRLECISDGSAAGNHATVGSHWIISQVNIDGAVVGPASAVSGRIAVFSGTSGRIIDQAPVAPADLLVAANNLSDLADKKTARANLRVEARTAQGDADHTFTVADGPVYALTAALTAPRAWTLPAASTLNAGARIWVVDEVGGVSATNTLTIARAGSDTIEGGTSLKLATPYGAVCLETDGVSKFTKTAVVSFDQVSHRLGDETSITSAATVDIGSSPTTRVVVAGATGPITSLGTVANKYRIVRFSGAPTLTHNGTSLVLPGVANITVAAGDIAGLVSDGSGNWRCLWYSKANGKAVIASTYADIGVRERATANRTYFARPADGSDSNTGLVNSAGGAFATLQKAHDTVAAIDWGGFTPTIQLVGTSSAVLTLRDLIGAVTPIVLGDEATPSNGTISRSGNCIEIDGLSTIWSIRGLKLVATGATAINVQNRGAFTWQNVDFGGATRQIRLGPGCFAASTGPYIISASAAIHIDLTAATVALGAFTVTVTSTPAFSSAFLVAVAGSRFYANSGIGAAFSGSATGTRHNLQGLSVADTNGGGASFLPGNATVAPTGGSQYV